MATVKVFAVTRGLFQSTKPFGNPWDFWFWAMSSPALLPTSGPFVLDGFDIVGQAEPGGGWFYPRNINGLRCLQVNRNNVSRMRGLVRGSQKWAVIGIDDTAIFEWRLHDGSISGRGPAQIPGGTKAVLWDSVLNYRWEQDYRVGEGTVLYEGNEAGALAEVGL
jgi:hypothetical protein